MKNTNTLTNEELDTIIRTIPDELSDEPFPAPKKWIRVDCGEIEVYVGDRMYVIALVEKLTDSETEIVDTQISTEDTVIKYLQNEGFLDDEYAYVGMQRFGMDSLGGTSQ